MGSFVLHGNIIDSESPERLRVADHDFSSQKAFPEDSLHPPCIYIVSQERSAHQPCGNFVYFTQI